MSTPDRRASVSLVCVYNDEPVLQHCLLRSVEAGLSTAPETEVVAVDNREHQFSSAGAALNHGARLARNEVVVFVHQDVYLHSLVSLELMAGRLLDGEVDLAGAAGITSTGRLAGRIRDRVILAGDSASSPIDVDSLDEVLFATTRSQVLDQPLSEHPDLAWHAYAVEYGLRVRRTGGRVAAVDVPLTHNSLSINMARLFEAHGAVGGMYPECVPVRTTCGTVGAKRQALLRGPFQEHRWRYRWVRDSLTTAAWHGWRGERDVVLSDLRETIDVLLAGADHDEPVAVVNALTAQDRLAPWPAGDPVTLWRRNRRITVGLAETAEILPTVEAAQETSFVVTNLDLSVAARLCDEAPGPSFAGFSQGSGAWCVLGPLAEARAQVFGAPRDRPLDVRLRLPASSRSTSHSLV